MNLICVVCENGFEDPAKRGPKPKTCSKACRDERERRRQASRCKPFTKYEFSQTEDERRCRVCAFVRPIRLFDKDVHSPGGRHTACRICRKKKAKKSPGFAQRKLLQCQRARASGYLPPSERARRAFAAKNRLEKAQQKAKLAAIRKETAKRKRAETTAKAWNRCGLSDAESFSIRYHCDPEFNLKEKLRTAMRRRRQGGKIGDRLRDALKRSGDVDFNLRTFLGYSVADLKRHLERQFTSNMSWGLFVDGKIHIDHVLPLASFDLADPAEVRAAWALANLRPLGAADNLEKAAKRTLLL